MYTATTYTIIWEYARFMHSKHIALHIPAYHRSNVSFKGENFHGFHGSKQQKFSILTAIASLVLICLI